MRLIDADALDTAPWEEPGDAVKAIRNAPTIDAVPVVRCKDCDKSKRSYVFGSGWRFCENNQQHHKDDHFAATANGKKVRADVVQKPVNAESL